MKKILAFSLSLILIIGAFSACSGNSKQYFVDNYNDFISQNLNEDGVNNTVSGENSASTTTDKDKPNNSSNSGSSSSAINSSGSSSNKPTSTSSGSSSNTSSDVIDKVYEINYDKLSSVKADKIPSFNFGSRKSSLVQDDRYITRAEKTTSNNYNSYVDELLKAGFAKYSENKIGNNLFVTLVNKVTTVTISFMNKDATTMVIAEPKTYLYPRKQDNNYKSGNIQTVFTGMKGETSVASEGMGFIIRLDDGSFIIIDGGMGDPNSVDSTKLYNILKEQSPVGTKKPVIAAWIFTHCHGDHIGVFNTFSIDYRDKVEIEAFYCNFQTEESILESDNFMMDNSIYRYKQFKKAMTQYYPNVPKVRVYTGNKLHIRNAVINVLYSYENLFPTRLSDTKHPSSNASSLVFTIDIAGQKFMITGDVEEYGMKFVNRNYSGNLKSDFLQMAHHGINSDLGFYSSVDPTYAILPVSFPNFNILNGSDANKWLRDSDNVRQIIEFSHQTVSIPIPYNPDDDAIEKIPNATTKYPTYPSLKVEVVKPASSVPAAWFDLGFKNGSPYDKKGNLTVTKKNGTVATTAVKYNGKSYNVTAYTLDNDGEGLLVNLPFKNKTEYGNWLLGGCTFELFVQINKLAEGTSGFFSNVNSGGASLYYRGSGTSNQLQFQIGTTNPKSASNNWNNYAAAAPSATNYGPVSLPQGNVVHCVGTYNPKNNMLSLYYNGKLVSSGSYGSGEFEIGSATYNVLGIGLNPSYSSESFGKTGSLTVIGAKLYKTALTESEVLKEYNDLIAALTK